MVTDELVSFLVGAGLAAGENVDVFYADRPDTPDTALIIEPFSGPVPIPTVSDPVRIERPNVQITVRDAADRGAAYRRADALLRSVGSISNCFLSGVWYLSVRPAHSSPISMPEDDQERPSYVLNFEVTKYPSL